MPCPQIEKLECFVKRELSSDEARAIEEHIAMCSDCRRQVGDLPENLEICDKLHEVVTAGDIGAETREAEPGERRVEVVAAEDDETVSVKVARAAERAPLAPFPVDRFRAL